MAKYCIEDLKREWELVMTDITYVRFDQQFDAIFESILSQIQIRDLKTFLKDMGHKSSTYYIKCLLNWALNEINENSHSRLRFTYHILAIDKFNGSMDGQCIGINDIADNATLICDLPIINKKMIKEHCVVKFSLPYVEHHVSVFICSADDYNKFYKLLK